MPAVSHPSRSPVFRLITIASSGLGSFILGRWGLQFGSIPERGSLTAYAERIRQREAYQAGKAIDNALIAEMQAPPQS